MKFYKTEITEIPNSDVLVTAYEKTIGYKRALEAAIKGEITLAERIGDGKCPDCGKDEWLILPVTPARAEGGKPYIECMHCGYVTHL